MIGPFFPDFSSSKLMKSEIVRKEMSLLERDYAELAKLGTRYEVSAWRNLSVPISLHASPT